MNINRNNYEEYFLLYVDNELSAAGKNMVEVFISENPDLKEELLMLQQTITRPDEHASFNKERLLKPVPVDADTEEKLLLLLDNELPAKEQQHVLSLIENNATIKTAWQLLQQTKLPAADSIVFEDKASLYRKEERRVVPIRWWQLAAAAMLIGFGLWGTVSYLNRNGQTAISPETVSTKGAKTNPAIETNPPVVGIVKDTLQAIVNINKDNTTAAAITAARLNKTVPVKATTITTGNNYKQTTIQQEEKDNSVIAQQQNNNEDQKPDVRNLNNNGSNIPVTANVTPETNNIETPETNTQPANTYAVNTVAGNSDESSFNTFDEEDDKPKKSKLGAFFKKVKRTFERKTKIKTGSSDDVKIANMSFAMH